jgi:hypothetical protein
LVPATHFVAEDVPLLAAYACSIAQQRRAADELAGGSKDRHWIDMHAQAVRSMNTLAIRLRLGPKARDRNNHQRWQATTRAQVSAYDEYSDLIGEDDRVRSAARTFDDLRRLRRQDGERK